MPVINRKVSSSWNMFHYREKLKVLRAISTTVLILSLETTLYNQWWYLVIYLQLSFLYCVGASALGAHLRQHSVAHQHHLRAEDAHRSDASECTSGIPLSAIERPDAVRTRNGPRHLSVLSERHESGWPNKVIVRASYSLILLIIKLVCLINGKNNYWCIWTGFRNSANV